MNTRTIVCPSEQTRNAHRGHRNFGSNVDVGVRNPYGRYVTDHRLSHPINSNKFVDTFWPVVIRDGFRRKASSADDDSGRSRQVTRPTRGATIVKCVFASDFSGHTHTHTND